MSDVLLWAGVVLEASVFLGLVVRRRVLIVATFPSLLLLFATSATLAGLCPECITWEYWAAKESAHGVLVLLLGLELIPHVFGADTRLRRFAWAWAGLMIGIVLVGLLLTTPPGPRSVALVPRIAAATAVLFAGLTGLMILGAQRGTIDPDDLPRTLLSSFAVYTVLYAATWSRTGDDTTIAGLVNPLVFNLVMVLILRAAWQRPPPTL